MDINILIDNNDFVSALNRCIEEKAFNLAYLIYKFAPNHLLSNLEYRTAIHIIFKNLTLNNSFPRHLLPDSYINPNNPTSSYNEIENDDMSIIRIYLMCNWLPSKDICNLWNKMSQKNNFKWDNIKIVWDEPADYYCVINKPNENLPTNFDKKKTILFQMEPYMERDPRQWGEWANISENDFLFCGKHNTYLNNNEWHLAKTYQQLSSEPIIKNESLNQILSSIFSHKYSDPGHVKRINFAKFIEQQNNIEYHVFGSNRFLWKNYKGQLPPYEKDDSLLPYKYTFNAENHSIKNYYTEKLIDGILSECLVFYNGCFNAKEFIDERAFVYLELSNFEKDYEIIKKAIEENWWEQRLPYIKEAKQKILNETQFFPRLKAIVDKHINKTTK